MAFPEAFEKIKTALKNAKGKQVDGHLAVEIVINDEENAGLCYLEVADHEVRVEPYDYWGHDARLIGRCEDLVAVFSGRLEFDAALEHNKLFIQGDPGRAMEVKKLIRKPAGRKPGTKVATSKSTPPPADKPAPKKRGRKPATKPEEGVPGITLPTQEQ